jgi:hypothetical protein
VVAGVAAAGHRRFEVDLPDTGGNADEFGYAGSGCEPVGVPEARVVALAECGSLCVEAGPIASKTARRCLVDGTQYHHLRPHP